MFADIQDIENKEDAVERDKDQVDDGSCGPVNHFAEEKHRKRLNAVRTREGSGRTGPLYRVCACRAVPCDRRLWHHNSFEVPPVTGCSDARIPQRYSPQIARKELNLVQAQPPSSFPSTKVTPREISQVMTSWGRLIPFFAQSSRCRRIGNTKRESLIKVGECGGPDHFIGASTCLSWKSLRDTRTTKNAESRQNRDDGVGDNVSKSLNAAEAKSDLVPLRHVNCEQSILVS